MKKNEPKKKLKRARGSLLRLIVSGRIEPPPGYMGIKEMERATAASVKQRSGRPLKQESQNGR